MHDYKDWQENQFHLSAVVQPPSTDSPYKLQWNYIGTLKWWSRKMGPAWTPFRATFGSYQHEVGVVVQQDVEGFRPCVNARPCGSVSPSRTTWPRISHSCCRAALDFSPRCTASRCAPRVANDPLLQPRCCDTLSKQYRSRWWSTSSAWRRRREEKVIRSVMTTNKYADLFLGSSLIGCFCLVINRARQHPV